MDIDQLETDLHELLGEAVHIDGEAGLVRNGCSKVRRIGYATNLTPETIAAATAHAVDCMITHHDAWDFLFGMDTQCHAALAEAGIAHFYAHLSLDAAAFGTAAALIHDLGATSQVELAVRDGYAHGRVGHFAAPVPVEDVGKRLSALADEPVRVWACGSRMVETIGVITGAGSGTGYVKEAAEAGCQLYITGEQSLYLVQYCMHLGMNLIVGSHTFTELPGVRALANLLKDRNPELDLIQLPETHYEALPHTAESWVQ